MKQKTGIIASATLGRATDSITRICIANVFFILRMPNQTVIYIYWFLHCIGSVHGVDGEHIAKLRVVRKQCEEWVGFQ